jgi:tetratricopeptide (TPR) repeat protein
MHSSLIILLTGILFIVSFGALSFLRRQGLSIRFVIEGLVLTAAFTLLAVASLPINPFLFLFIIYLITMRVRLLVDLGNWFTSRRKHERALALFRLALRLGPDAVGRKIVLINRGVTQLYMQEPETAYFTLKAVLLDEEVRPAAKYLAAGYYNLGLASRRTGREAEAIQHFNEAISVLPKSIYAYGAMQALKQDRSDKT